MTTEFKNFTEGFEALKRSHKTLEDMREPDVDAIAPCVETAVLAGRFCMERIEAVRKIVGELETKDAANAPA